MSASSAARPSRRQVSASGSRASWPARCRPRSSSVTSPGADRRGPQHVLSRNDSRYLKELVARTAPEALFFGHLHQPTREEDFGGSRCFTLRSCAWNFQGAPLGFLLVTVDGDRIATREILTSAEAPPAK